MDGGVKLVRSVLKTNPLKIFKQALLGLKLWRQGRIGLHSDVIQNRDELRKILSALD